MKKAIIFFTFFSFLSFGLVLPALADEAVSPANGSQTSATSTPEATKPAFKPRQIVMYGDLTVISQPTVPSELMVKASRLIPKKIAKLSGIYPQKDALVKTLVTEKTKIVRKYMGRADFSELAVGDKLMVTGKLQADGSIKAQLVKDDSIHKTFNAQKGEVLAIDATAQTFNMKVTTKKATKEYKIFVTSNTKFAKWGVEKPTFADLKIGDKVNVRGVIRQVANEITADSVVIQVDKAEILKIQAEQKAENLKKQLEKKKANLIKQLEKKKAQLEKKIEKVKGKVLENAQKELEGVNKQLEQNSVAPTSDQNTSATTTVTQ